MEEQITLWIIAGIASAMLLRRLITAITAQRRTANDYTRELHDILTKEEHKVKGRFE